MEDQLTKELLNEEGGKVMTDYGYDYILNKINEDLVINTPAHMTLEQLNAWLEGYTMATTHIVQLIEKIKDEYSQGR